MALDIILLLAAAVLFVGTPAALIVLSAPVALRVLAVLEIPVIPDAHLALEVQAAMDHPPG